MTIAQTVPQDQEIEAVTARFKALTGITIPLEKRVMVAARLRRRLDDLGGIRIPGYLARVEANPEEQQVFINLLTTNETFFFRTTRIWEAFRETILPEASRQNPPGALRIWSAACSTGEEAYSIAICCRDHQRAHPGFRAEILATDIDSAVLAACQEAKFAERAVQRFKEGWPDLFRTYLTPVAGGYRPKEEVRTLIRFQGHNLMKPLRSGGPFDVVFLRNVLIYFRDPEILEILGHVAACMKPGGTLILGESESISRLTSQFRIVEPLVYRRL